MHLGADKTSTMSRTQLQGASGGASSANIYVQGALWGSGWKEEMVNFPSLGFKESEKCCSGDDT